MTARNAEFQQLVVRETGVSIVINIGISAIMFCLLFPRFSDVSVRGMGGFAVDFLPQAFMVALMGSLIPGLLIRRKAGAARSARAVVVRSFGVALLALVLAGGGAGAILLLSGASVLPWSAALVLKLLFGGALAAVVTPLAIHHATSTP